MLLIDGVKYEEWTPPSEDEFEQVVKKHAQDIFGKQSIYLDIKTRLKSKLGIGSIPDGFVIFFGDVPRWRIVEVELSGHPLHDHIVAQVGRFISGIENLSTQKKIVDTVYSEVVKSDLDALKLRKSIQPIETYKFLLDIISKPPILTIIIEEETPELKEALKILNYPQIEVVEFKTFAREGVGLGVHAHLFEPVFQVFTEKGAKAKPQGGVSGKKKQRIPVTVKDLIDANILKIDQVIYRPYKGNKWEARILHDGKIKLLFDDNEYNSLSTAAKSIAGSVDGWEWWRTTRENGSECVLDELRKTYRATHP